MARYRRSSPGDQSDNGGVTVVDGHVEVTGLRGDGDRTDTPAPVGQQRFSFCQVAPVDGQSTEIPAGEVTDEQVPLQGRECVAVVERRPRRREPVGATLPGVGRRGGVRSLLGWVTDRCAGAVLTAGVGDRPAVVAARLEDVYLVAGVLAVFALPDSPVPGWTVIPCALR